MERTGAPPADDGQLNDCLRFDGVTLRRERCELLLDGRPRPCSRKAFELLWALACYPRRARTRDELIAALWPGGQIISDDALTQVVFRARSVIGPYGKRITTIRGVGFALDADVEAGEVLAESDQLEPSGVAENPDEPGMQPVLTGSAPLAEAGMAAGPAADEPAASPGFRPARWVAPALVASLVALLAALLPVLWNPGPETARIDDGYGFALEDLQASKPQTPGLFAEALQREAVGERERAVSLMQALHESDPATPLPALMIALWSSGAREQARNGHWMAEAGLRIGQAS